MNVVTWRTELREARALVRKSEAAHGKERALLVDAAKIVARLRESRKDSSAFRRAEWGVEVMIGHLARACDGCMAMEPDPRKRSGHSSLRRHSGTISPSGS